MRFPCTVPLSLISHGRGEISSWLWWDTTTAVTNTYHGRGELPIPAS